MGRSPSCALLWFLSQAIHSRISISLHPQTSVRSLFVAASLSAVFIHHAYQWLSTFPREYGRLESTSLYAPSQPANDGLKADFTPMLPPPRGLVQLVQLLQQMQKLKQSKENKRRKAEIAGTSIQQSTLPPSR